MKAKVAYAVLLCLMGYGAGAMANGEKRGMPPIITGATPQPDYIFNGCKETQEMGGPHTAWRTINPVGMLVVYIENNLHRMIDSATEASIKPTLLQGPMHGNLVEGTSTSGRTAYRYDPTPGYIGDDRATFMAEFEGKMYKVVVDIKVLRVVDINASECPPPKLIKVTKPSTGDAGIGAGYNLGSVNVTFGDLAVAAVGQTIGNTITIDTNAAGHNWFIDTTPWDNSDYLATSQLKGVASH